MELRKLDFAGWTDCLELSNGLVRVVLSTGFGPRVLSYAREGGPELLGLIDGDRGFCGGDHWRLYGGHRLWHAPEAHPRSYAPDNAPVDVRVEQSDGFVRLEQAVEPSTGIRKSLELRLAVDSTQLELRHSLRNEGLWPVRLAPWAITIMRRGGVAILPLPKAGSHEQQLQPTAKLALWAYTRLDDERLEFGARAILMHQRELEAPCKLGLGGGPGWLAYAFEDELFVKRFDTAAGEYPDQGCSAELYTDARVLELESLGPLCTLEPGAACSHVERWQVFGGQPPVRSAAALDEHPSLRAWLDGGLA